ncbi:DUF2147 domain-containing protein [Myroides sp. LJL119]
MKNLFSVLITCILVMGSLNAQSVIGKWKTIDDATGKEKSIVEIYKQDQKYYGKIIELLNPSSENPLCTKCSGERKNQPITGLVFITNMQEKSGELSGGRILDPETGKEYKCTIKLDGPDRLDVRGFVGISLIGRTQSWTRVK